MTDPKPGFARRTLPLVLVLLTSTGCSTFQAAPDNARYQPVEPGLELSAAQSADAYLAVRQARAQNGVVLQVVDDEVPNRILPLPSGGKSVFVSNLLEQTGLLNKLENVDVVLFRSSPRSISGIQMAVKMTPDGHRVRPESDYALQPGDRVRVSRVEKDTFRSLMDVTLGRE